MTINKSEILKRIEEKKKLIRLQLKTKPKPKEKEEEVKVERGEEKEEDFITYIKKAMGYLELAKSSVACPTVKDKIDEMLLFVEERFEELQKMLKESFERAVKVAEEVLEEEGVVDYTALSQEEREKILQKMRERLRKYKQSLNTSQ